MKTIGIIGGFGPEATASFYCMLTKKDNEQKKQAESYPEILIYNMPLSYKVEEEFVLHGTNKEIYIDGIVALAATGKPDFYVIPCNTLHLYIDEIRRKSKKNILSIVDSAANFLSNQRISGKSIKKVYILGTSLTITKGLYTEKLKEFSIETVLPSEHDRQKLSEAIYKFLNEGDSSMAVDFIKSLSTNPEFRECDCVLLACTDLNLMKASIRKFCTIPVYDSLEILAKTCLETI